MTDKEIEKSILEIVENYHTKTNGKCGIDIIKISEKLDVELIRIKSILNSLFKKNKITIRTGINHNLIFMNK